MADIFEKWDKQIDGAQYMKDIEDIEKNGGQNYEEVPYGEYEVEVEKLEVKPSKKGDPMVSAWFKILAGQYKGQRIFMNQVILQPFQIKNANDFLQQLDTGVSVKFQGSYKAYGDLLMDIKEAIDGQNLQYGLEYGCNAKGFNTFKITEVFEG